MTEPGADLATGRDLYPVIRLAASLALMTVATGAMFALIVVLKPIGTEFEINRSMASLPYALFMMGFGVGGIVLGKMADRVGILWPALVSAIAVPAGFIAAAQATNLWQFNLAVGLLLGLFGAGATFAPLIADISHWFTARRGLAVGVVISGTYLAGAIWPWLLQGMIDDRGWRQAFTDVGLACLVIMLPLAGVLYRRPPGLGPDSDGRAAVAFRRPLGLRPPVLQCLICAAGVGCCTAMAMPQVHIVAYATDLGYAAARGAEMLSLMLGSGIVSRLVSGWISDRIGGLNTLMLGSAMQALVLVLFLFADSLTALYATAIAFGLSQGGIVPSYAIIVRTFFPPGDAGWRIGMAVFFTVVGMAFGGWIAGLLYDLTGSYTASFLNAIGFNIGNLAIAGFLLRRAQGQRLGAAA